jgi:uncharacterized membrane protein YGL010W
MTVSAHPTGATNDRVAWFLRAWFVVPWSQVHILDLGYQTYCFEVFHKSRLNRTVHAIGIPLSLMATYVLVSSLRWGSLLVPAFVVAVHLAIALRSRLYAAVPALLVAHAGLWLFASRVLAHVLLFEGPVWLHPAFHVVLWPALQYVTHIFEVDVPPPVSGIPRWRSRRELLSQASAGYLVFAFALAPLHILVELISSYRNLFVLLVLASWHLGYRPESLSRLMAWIREEAGKDQPLVELDAFRAASVLSPGFADESRTQDTTSA